jgi:hypothetical protein
MYDSLQTPGRQAVPDTGEMSHRRRTAANFAWLSRQYTAFSRGRPRRDNRPVIYPDSDRG